ncbi:MAG: transcriptional regulator/antitoxin MazE [Pseudomonadota bacterium]
MIKTKIHKVGDDVVMTLTPDMLDFLGAQVGDSVYVVHGDDGCLKLPPIDPDVAAALEAGKVVMDENWEALRAMAKG